MISKLLSPKTITKYDRAITHLFLRYDIDSESNTNLEDICKKNNINTNLLVDLAECYNNINLAKNKTFESYQILDLIDYLEKSHSYYLNKRIPEIEQSLHKSFLHEKHSFNLLFIKFFKEYKKDIVIHFKNEEQNLFPFCKVLVNYSKTNSQENLIYLLENKNNVLNQLKNHQKNSEEINNLQRLLINYKVDSKKLSFFEVFLNQMSIFQKDLKIHAEIEDHVLTNKVLNLMEELDLKDVLGNI